MLSFFVCVCLFACLRVCRLLGSCFRVRVCWLVCLIGCLFVGFVCVCVRVCVDSACKRLFASFLIVCVCALAL